MFELGATFYKNDGTLATGLTNVTASINDLHTGAGILTGIPLPEIFPGHYGTSIALPVVKPVTTTITTTQTAELTNNIAYGANLNGALSINALQVPMPLLDEDKLTHRCPYCFSKILPAKDVNNFIWHIDPVFMYAQKVYPQYRGYCKCLASVLLDIQTNRKMLEALILPENDMTVFSDFNVDGKFIATSRHLAELRYSTEKLLYYVGYTKIDYFTLDEFGKDRTQNGEKRYEWIDSMGSTDGIENGMDPRGIPYLAKLDIDKIHKIYAKNYNPTTGYYDKAYLNLGLTGFQIKGLHIEDLRHFLPSGWMEPWLGTFNQNTHAESPQPGGGENGDLKEQTILSKHTWYMNEWSYAQSTIGTVGGTLYGSSIATANLNISKQSFSAISNTSVYLNATAHTGQARARHYILCQDINNPSVLLSENMGLVIKNLQTSSGGTQLYDVTQHHQVYILINTQPLNPIPGDPWIIGYKYGFGGSAGIDGIWHPDTLESNMIQLDSMSGDMWKRNLYEDYKTLYGVYPSAIPITNIVIFLPGYTYRVTSYAQLGDPCVGASSISFDVMYLHKVPKIV